MPQLTLADLRARVYARVDGNTELYPTTEVDQAVTESARALQLICQWYQQPVQLDYPTQKNRVWYSVPDSLFCMTRLQIDGKFIKKASLQQLGRARVNWVTENTASQMQPITYWIPLGLKKFGIWPSDSCGGKQMIVTGPVDIQPYTDPNQTVPLSNDLLSSFDTLAVQTLLLKESPRTFSDASVQYKEFLRVMKKITVLRDWHAPSYFVAELQQPQNKD